MSLCTSAAGALFDPVFGRPLFVQALWSGWRRRGSTVSLPARSSRLHCWSRTDGRRARSGISGAPFLSWQERFHLMREGRQATGLVDDEDLSDHIASPTETTR